MSDESAAFVPLGRHHPLIRRVRGIAERGEPGLTLLDGVTLIADAAAHGARIVEIYATAGQLSTLASIPAIVELARGRRAFLVDEATAQRLAPTQHAQGAVAVVELVPRNIPVAGVVVYLAAVQDPGNVGGIIRSAAAFGAAGVACSPGCADPFSPRVLRASAGHALFLPVTTGTAFDPLAASIRAAGGTIAATAGDGGTPVDRWRPSPPVLVVFGSEGAGIDKDILDQCDATITIPIAAAVESLNVAVAAGIVLHALTRSVRQSS